MSERPENRDWEHALRDGLRGLPVPSPSSDFDGRILGALQKPGPGWRTLWHTARPLLAGASCAAFVTLAGLSWSLHTPAPTAPASSSTGAATRPLDMAALDRLLDRPGLCYASLAALEASSPTAPTPTDGRHPPPKRRVSRLDRPWIA